jgi:hypothetical protein
MTDDREPFREARAAWKAKHHEQRLENATYTAAEVKVLTAKARQDAADEIAAYLDGVHEVIGDGAQRELFSDLAETVRDIGSKEASA